MAKSVHALRVSENYVSVRRHRMFKLLPSLMEMTKADYQRFCFDYEGGAFAGGNVLGNELILFNTSNTKISVLPIRRANPILPSLDPEIMAARLMVELGL